MFGRSEDDVESFNNKKCIWIFLLLLFTPPSSSSSLPSFSSFRSSSTTSIKEIKADDADADADGSPHLFLLVVAFQLLRRKAVSAAAAAWVGVVCLRRPRNAGSVTTSVFLLSILVRSLSDSCATSKTIHETKKTYWSPSSILMGYLFLGESKLLLRVKPFLTQK